MNTGVQTTPCEGVVPTSERIYTFNTVVTGRCNVKCSYCHFYATRNRRQVAYDVSGELFEVYMGFIKRWAEEVEGTTSYRFSGGDPMVLGDRLFRLAETGYRITGIKPFMLTAGLKLDQNWVRKARQAPFSHVFVSIENPIEPDKFAPNPLRVIEAIRELNSPELPIIAGVCVVPSHLYARLDEICEWFYEKIKHVPLICEVNYAPYKTPTDQELAELDAAVERTLKKFFHKTPLNLFSSVVPEYAYGGIDPYLSDLGLENPHGITYENMDEKIQEMLNHIDAVNYPRLQCNQTECPWHQFCGNTKWYWQGDGRNSPELKLSDYCRHKKTISGAYARALLNPSFVDATGMIDLHASHWTPRPGR